MATLLSDTFDRANSTTAVGAPQVGPTPVAQTGVLGISSNLLYPVTLATNEAWLTYDLGTPNVEMSVVRGVTGAQIDLIVGFTSTTDFYVWSCQSSGGCYLYRRVGSTFVLLSGAGPASALNLGDTVKASIKDGVFRGYFNGTRLVKTPLPSTPGNLHGIRFVSTGGRGDNLLGVDAPALEGASTGGFRTVDRVATVKPSVAFFPYRGRDTKALDTSGVA